MKVAIYFIILFGASFTLGNHFMGNGMFNPDCRKRMLQKFTFNPMDWRMVSLFSNCSIRRVNFVTGDDGFVPAHDGPISLSNLTTFSVMTPNDRIINFPGFDYFTINSVKARIEMSSGIPSDRQMLMFNGRELENHKALKYYNINENSTIVLQMKEKSLGDWQITVTEYPEYLTKEKHTFQISSSTTVKQLMEKIEEATGVPPKGQHLSYRRYTNLFDEDKTLNDYDVYNNTVIVMDRILF